MSSPNVSVLAGHATLAVTAVTGNVALPAVAGSVGAITLYNAGTSACYFALGADDTVVATTSSTPLYPGQKLTCWFGSNTYLSAICGGSDTTTVAAYVGNGPL